MSTITHTSKRWLSLIALVAIATACDRGCDLSGGDIGGGGNGGGGSGGSGGSGNGPSAETLCAQTGGVWERSECACAQDGASLHNEFVAGVGCRFPDDSDLIEDLQTLPFYDAIAEYFAVGRTVYLIDRPGAFDVVHKFSTIGALRAHIEPIGWLQVSAAAGACDRPIVASTIPEVDCDDDNGMTFDGCVLSTVSDEFHRVSFLMQAAIDYGFGYWSQVEIDRARAEEQYILKVFVSSEHGVTLAFRRHAGTWVLVVVELNRYSCSA